jgi:hypothetical protein
MTAVLSSIPMHDLVFENRRRRATTRSIANINGATATTSTRISRIWCWSAPRRTASATRSPTRLTGSASGQLPARRRRQRHAERARRAMTCCSARPAPIPSSSSMAWAATRSATSPRGPTRINLAAPRLHQLRAAPGGDVRDRRIALRSTSAAATFIVLQGVANSALHAGDFILSGSASAAEPLVEATREYLPTRLGLVSDTGDAHLAPLGGLIDYDLAA